MMKRTLLLLLTLLAIHGGARGDTGSDLFAGIDQGDLPGVRRLLEGWTSPDATDDDGVNALYYACDKEQPAIAQLLVDQGANVNLTPPHGSTALQVSIYRGFDSYKLKPREGYPELIRKLIEKGADVNAADVNGETPVMAAAKKDDVATLELLLQRGADLAAVNENGWTALELAVMNRRRTIARKLFLAGAPLDGQQQKLLRHYQFARMAGNAFPLILVGSFLLAAAMAKRFKDLPKPPTSPEAGDDLPHLQPLKCGACGGSASLKPGVATCSHCHEPVPVPQDYTEVLALRARTFKLLEKAVRLWKRVRLVSVPPVQLALWAVAIGFVWYMWQGIFPLFVREAFYDLMTFLGTMVWALGVLAMSAIAIALGGYAIYLAIVRATVPPLPEKTPALAREEAIPCPNCAGVVELQPGDLVGICGYCGSETYRVALARTARAAAAADKQAAAVSLHQAMSQVYELRENAALAIPLAMVVIGFLLVLALRVLLFFI